MLKQFMIERSHSNLKFVTNRSSRKGNLKNHVASVHEDNKPFKCDTCEYSCSEKQQMKLHFFKKHEGKQQQL